MTNSIYQHYQGYEAFIKIIQEGIFRYERDYLPVSFGFLGIDKARIAQKLIGNRVPYSLSGGYEGAFSRRLIIGENIDIRDYIVCLKAQYNSKFIRITHRDVLGAVMNLGIEPETFGDLWVEDDRVYLYCTPEMADFICRNLTKISRYSFQFERTDEYPVQQFRFKESRLTVSSYRLDRIVAGIIRKSREKAQMMIRGSLVQVNYAGVEDCDHLCNNGDILSIRGYGRYLIGEEIAETRSGNHILVIRQYV